MRMVTNSRLQLSWWTLSGAIVIALLIPGASLHDPLLTAYVNSDWAHFLAYAVVGAIALFAWKLRTALATCAGVAVVSFGLQVLRGLVTKRGLDFDGAIINLLGIAAGVLMALNIRRSDRLTSRMLTSSSVRLGSDPLQSMAIKTNPRVPEPAQEAPSPGGSPRYVDQFRLRTVDVTAKE